MANPFFDHNVNFDVAGEWNSFINNLSDNNKAKKMDKPNKQKKEENVKHKEGDAIIPGSQPWIFVVDCRRISSVCFRCLAEPTGGKMQKCSSCKYAFYCSKECQYSDWGDCHKLECEALKLDTFQDRRLAPDATLLTLFLRAIIKLLGLVPAAVGSSSSVHRRDSAIVVSLRCCSINSSVIYSRRQARSQGTAAYQGRQLENVASDVKAHAKLKQAFEAKTNGAKVGILHVFGSRQLNKSAATHMYFNLADRQAFPARDPFVTQLYESWASAILAVDKDRVICPDATQFERMFKFMGSNVSPLHRESCQTNTQPLPAKECEIGLALYLNLPDFKRSCMPNGMAVVTGGRAMVVRAIRTICNDEEVFVPCPIDRFATTAVRKMMLNDKFLICTCPACTDPTMEAVRHGLRCEQTSCGTLLTLDTRKQQKCGRCGMICSQTRLIQAEDLVKRFLALFDILYKTRYEPKNVKDDNVKQVTALYSQGRELLHATNFLMGLAARQLALDAKSQHRYGTAARYWKAMLPAAERHMGKYDDIVMEGMLELMVHYYRVGKLDEGKMCLMEVRDRMRVIPGEDSKDYKYIDSLAQEMNKRSSDFARFVKKSKN